MSVFSNNFLSNLQKNLLLCRNAVCLLLWSQTQTMQRLSRSFAASAASVSSRSASSTSGPASVVLVDGIRIPFTLAGTAYKDLMAVDLGRLAMKGILDKTALDPKLVREIPLSHSLTISRLIIFITGLLFKNQEQATLLVNLLLVLEFLSKFLDTL
jgi:hypothetical protein